MDAYCVIWHHLYVKKYGDNLPEANLFLLPHIFMKSTGNAKVTNYTLYDIPGIMYKVSTSQILRSGYSFSGGDLA